MARCWEWCLEEGFEPIETCTADEDSDHWLACGAPLVLQDSEGKEHEGEEVEEPQGLPRVLEALQAHMWSRMTRKLALASASAAPAQENSHNEERREEYKHEEKQMHSSTSVPSSTLDVEIDQPLQLLSEEIDIELEDQGEKGFVEMLQQMQHLRQEVSNDKIHISDIERRKRAEFLAFKLMALMGDE